MFNDAEAQRREYDDAQSEDLAFLFDFDHYGDGSADTPVPGRVRPKGRKVWGVHRHKVGQLVSSPIYLNVEPKEEMPTEQAAQLADIQRSFLEQVIADPEKRFYDVREEMIACALAARLGSYKWEFDRRIGPYGDLICTTIDPRNLRWEPGYHPHDPRCPWVYEKARIRTDLIPLMEGWRNTDNLRGDSGVGPATTHSGGPPGLVDLHSSASPNLQTSTEFTYTTVVYLYERNLKVTKRIETGRVTLKPGERYMVCMGPDETGCGYRSETQAEQQRDGTLDPGEELPKVQYGACPGLEDGVTCGMTLKRVDEIVQEYDDEGEHSFTIFAPYESGEDGGPRIFVGGDGSEPWPYDTRTVPYVIFGANVRPFRVMGQSETSVNKSLQLADNLLDRMALETMMMSRPYWAVPTNYVDWRGERWEFGDEQGLCAYFDPFAAQSAPIQMLQTPGLPAAWGLLKNTISSELREDMGTNDITFGQGESKDIPVGTVRRLERLGEIPVAQQLDRLRRAESFGMMVASDIMRSAYTEKRLVRMKGKDGSRIYAMMKAADLPEFDITITADPNVVQFDTDKVNGLLQLFNAPPPVRKQLAKALNISTQTMKEFEDEMKVWEEQQAARQPQGGNTGGGAPTPPAPPPNLGPGGPAGVAPATNGALAGA